jgi:hypothetical protein
MEHKSISLKLKVWKQKNSETAGRFETYEAKNISTEMSFLEMFDVLNERLIAEGSEPIAFDHDCREGICGMCSMYINGRPHGPWHATTTCQLHMRAFQDGETIVVEPWRANAFPVIKDLIVDRTSFDRIIQAGGYIRLLCYLYQQKLLILLYFHKEARKGKTGHWPWWRKWIKKDSGVVQIPGHVKLFAQKRYQLKTLPV